MQFFGVHLQSSVEFLIPKTHLYGDLNKLEGEQPGLYSQIKCIDEIRTRYVTKLTEASDQLKSLHQKMVTSLTNNVAWSLQRFCQIVDNKGNPLPITTRVADHLTTPVIPKLKDLSNKQESVEFSDQDALAVSAAPLAVDTSKDPQSLESLLTPRLNSTESSETSSTTAESTITTTVATPPVQETPAEPSPSMPKKGWVWGFLSN